MTNELEKQFFDTFGIEPKPKCAKPLLKTTTGFCKAYKNCVGCDYNDLQYPQITDRILLELICILTKFYGELVLEQCLDVKDLKEQVLNIFIRTSYKDNFKHQVRTLFEEG